MGLFSKDKNQQIILDEKDFRKFVGALKEHGQLVKLIGPGFAAGSVTALWNKWSGGRPTFQFSTSDKSQWKDIFGGLLTYEMLMVRQGHDHISALQLRARTGGFADEFTDKIMPSADYNARDTDSNEDRATAYIVHTSNSLKTSADVPNAPITRTGVKDALRNAAMYDVRSETVLRDLHRRSVNQASLKPTRCMAKNAPYPSTGGAAYLLTKTFELARGFPAPPAGSLRWFDLSCFLLGAVIRSHGFTDGNGRVGRAAYAAAMLKGQRHFVALRVDAEKLIHGLSQVN
jgi:hypothetical protein